MYLPCKQELYQSRQQVVLLYSNLLLRQLVVCRFYWGGQLFGSVCKHVLITPRGNIIHSI